MLYTKYFVTCAFLIFSNITFTNDDTELESDRIAWDGRYQIEWTDFKATADNSSTLDAYTMLGISLEIIKQGEGVVDMGVFGYFEKNKSWVKPNEKNDHLLLHERKHFDLCEVYRRKLIKRLESKKSYSFKNFSDEVSQSFNENFKEYTEEQERYDHETNHSQKKDIQIQWNNFIAKELLRLKKYDKIAATLVVK